MKKLFLATVCAVMFSSTTQATITCRYITLRIDSNQSIPLDIDSDGTNDYILLAQYTPYVNNYLVGLSGNEIEVTAPSGLDANRCRRIESGDPVGTFSWNDTAYMIENGLGSFSGGSEEYGHIGLRLNKGGSYHYAFLEVRTPYWQAMVEVYAIGYNDAAGAETRTDACPQQVGISNPAPETGLYLRENQLFVEFKRVLSAESDLYLFNTAGQIIFSGKLNRQATVIPLDGLQNGSYVAVVTQAGEFLARRKITLIR